MGEFQAVTSREQDLLIDTTLASALVAYDGDVGLLLPALRPDVRALFGHPEFVAKVHEFVAARRHDPMYRRAFASNTPLRESLPHVDPSPPTSSSRARIKWYSAIVLTAWRRWWTALNSAVASILRPAKSAKLADLKAVEPKPAEPIVEPQVEPSAPESCGATIVLEEFTGRCENGIIVADPIGYRLCPSCLGKGRRVA